MLYRRSRLLLILAISAAALAAGAPVQTGAQQAAAAAASKPNFLFISLDDLNDWIGPLGGHPQARTPNMDRLARSAVTFTRAYASSPSCNPSRTALMSGKAAYVTGMYSNYQDWRQVMPGEIMLPNHFKRHGYWTGGAGKMFHYNQVDPTSWSEYWPSQQRNMPEEPSPAPGKVVSIPEWPGMYRAFDWAEMDLPVEKTGDYQSVSWAIDKLQTLGREQPFLLAVGIYKPHVPWYLPKRYFDMFPLDSIQLPKTLPDDLDDIPERGRELAHRTDYHENIVAHGKWKEAVRAYLAAIAYADDMVGRLLDALEKSPHAGNTIVVLWSDHGAQLGEKEHWQKFALWENVARSVLMIKVPERASAALPGGSPAGARTAGIASLLDIFPTLTDLAAIPAKPGVTGRSLVPLLHRPQAQWNHPAITTYDYDEFSIRTDRYRYIRYIDGSEELYDESNDPEEWRNLAADSRYDAVKKQMATHIPKERAPLGPVIELEPHHVPPFGSLEQYQQYKLKRTHAQ